MDYTGILDGDGRFGKEVRVPRHVRTRFQHDTFRQTRQAKEGRGLERKDWASTTCTPGVGGWMDGQPMCQPGVHITTYSRPAYDRSLT
ncbi:hypothetical protein VTJ04DRAFT_2602 [Mycothermus thermophilus]|uniref:uncharacterized protein n=1 Tax=Humicola insolens TaxID=85995 RepID=UPI003743BA0F